MKNSTSKTPNIVTLTLEGLYKILCDCDAVQINGSWAACYLSPLTGEQENEFVYFDWRDKDGDECSTKLIEECAETIEYDGSLISIRDDEDEVVTIQPFVKYTSNNDQV